MMRNHQRAAALFSLVLTGCSAPLRGPNPLTLAPGAKYVALGSSYAAGPGIPPAADTPPNRCARSARNYAHQLAEKRQLALTDVSCSGAATTHVLGPWGSIPPQIDAVDQDTALVTLTIGGNDLQYIGGLMAASCRTAAIGGKPPACPPWPNAMPTEQALAQVAAAMDRIAAEVRRRAPGARLVFVDYPAVLAPDGVCDATPLTEEQARIGRATARLLTATTAKAAGRAGADLLRASAITAGHHVCAAEPWMLGYARPGQKPIAAPYHPNLAGMSAVAEALDRLLEN